MQGKSEGGGGGGGAGFNTGLREFCDAAITYFCDLDLHGNALPKMSVSISL